MSVRISLLLLLTVSILYRSCDGLSAEEQEVPSAVEIPSPTSIQTPNPDPGLTKHPNETVAIQDAEKRLETKPATEELPVDLQSKRQQLAQRVNDVQRSLESARENGTGVPESAERLSREVELLKQLDVLYAQLQSAEEFRKETESGKQELEKRLTELRLNGPKEQRPYSFLTLDGLRDSLATQESRAANLEASVSAANESAVRARQSLEQKQAERRRIAAAAQANKDVSKSGDFELQMKLVDLELNTAEQTVLLRTSETTNAKLAQESNAILLTLLREQIALMRQDAFFSESDLQTRLVDIEKLESELRQDIRSGEASLSYYDRILTEVRQKLDAQSQPAASETEAERSWKLARDCQMRSLSLTQKHLERLGPLRDAWRFRHRVAMGNVPRQELGKHETNLLKFLQQLDLDRRLYELQIGEIRKELADLDARLQKAKNEDADWVRWIEKEKYAYQNLIEAYNGNLIRIESTRKLHQRLLDEINDRTKRITIFDSVSALSAGIIAVWNYEIVAFEDNSLTVGKVCVGMLLLFGGVFLSRKVSGLFARRLLPHVGVHDGAAVAIELLMFYALVLTTALMALHTINIPLTVFTFMGGAVAIGVGFGSQNLLNNFISGVLLLIERPIRVGDAIEVANLFGLVEHIGVRSTRIRTGTNLEIIVPNSSFLEGNVVNWTLSDTNIRCCVKVGLSYGSPTREATRQLKRAADEHGLVLKKPEPFVWFAEFGDNSLDFELHFWISVRTLADRKRIESDLRFMIDQYFRDAGIVIAYPQRDVHLNSAAPVEVRILNTAETDNETEELKKIA